MTAPPDNAEIAREIDPVRREILAAIQRILLGQPKQVAAGSYTISDLAVEAQMGRHHLYQKYHDLKDRFEYLRDKADQPSKRELQLQQALNKKMSEVKGLRTAKQDARRAAEDWKALTELLARAINVLQEELHQEQLKSERLTRRLQTLEHRAGHSSPVVLIHKRPVDEPDS
jgi:chromosome segregation ATPase